MTIAAIESRWIDGSGGRGDLERLVGRLGNDIRQFALHTLGWIRVQEVLGYLEIEFDPRATHPASIAALLSMVRGFERASTLSFVKASAYTGRSWVAYTCTGREIDGLAEWIWAVAEFGGAPIVPSAITVSDLPDRAIANESDPDLRYVLGTWRMTGGRLDLGEPSPWPMKSWSGPRPYVNLKVLRRDCDGQIVFGAYRPALTSLWETEVSDRFVDARVTESVPDRALAQCVVRSALRTLAGGQPLAERFAGPCLRSDGSVEELDWMRISLPTASSATGELDSLIVFCRILSLEERKQMIGCAANQQLTRPT
ncbi:MAG: hypothetical protein RLO51_04195 [Thalassobaculum sp.]|uniref:hypothetical protein n=1 Tax=Thalassobaculum sp. TaxID=2022740 RepID=UPI0032EE98D7